MKKTFLVLLSLMICALTINTANAGVKATSPELAKAIKMYKTKDYAQSYVSLSKIVEKDPSNALAYYYLAMTSAQMGKKQEAIENYSKVITLSPNGRVGLYAKKGQECLQDSSKCHGEVSALTDFEKFIYGKYGNGFSEEAYKVHEKQKIESMKREINRNNDVEPRKFKEYKDFSSEVPTNDEIVNAIRTLQRAGITNGYNADLSVLTGNYSNSGNNEYELLNMLLGNKNTSSNLSPQFIQSMLTTQMSAGF